MLPATLLLKKPGPPGLFGPPCKRFKYNRYFCKCDATFSRVKPCTLIKSKMRFGTALSMPNWFTALTNCWCSSADQTTRGFFEPPPVFPPDCPAPGVLADLALAHRSYPRRRRRHHYLLRSSCLDLLREIPSAEYCLVDDIADALGGIPFSTYAPIILTGGGTEPSKRCCCCC